ncbi:MAG TPA: SMC-Scp complex subunit ScpB [Pirellulales bacterium]|jgi:segregation and condensation protein B|nr:SMC-Scp complex subunit ScpB [Pirellulales bacterium]
MSTGNDSPQPTAAAGPLDLGQFQAKPAEAGLSLDQLNAAFAEMLGSGNDPYDLIPPEPAAAEETLEAAVAQLQPTGEPIAEDPCEITPRNILEAMLFVGGTGDPPLTSEQIASLMRGVRPAEIDELAEDLNRYYAAANCPYQIERHSGGLRLVLRETFARIRERFLGKVRQTQLSPAAIEVLSLVAYHEPLTSERVSQLRGAPSGHLLTLLVGKQLLRMERVASQRGASYRTTPRFLSLFGLKSLDDLPRSENLDRD